MQLQIQSFAPAPNVIASRWPSFAAAATVLFPLAFLSGFPSPVEAQSPVPVAQYSFDEGTGTNAADTSGNGLTGTLTNGATWGGGQYGSALRLDGVNDYVNLGNPTALQLTGSVTISAWISSSTFPFDDAVVVSKRNNGSSGYQLDTTIDRGPRTIGFKLTTSSGANMARYGTTPMQANVWYHVAGVYDAAARTMNVYLNGQLDNGTLLGSVTAAQQNSTQNVQIGQRPGSPGPYNFAGAIDQVRIYNTALTAAQIRADMNTPIGGAGGTDTTPPSAPGTLTLSTVSSSQINLSWGAATDNVAVTGYRVERCAGAGCTTFTQIATPAATSYSDPGLTASTSYSYRVRAADAAGNFGAFSNTGSATTQAATDAQPPTAPGSLSATPTSSTQVNLSWTASTDNVGVTGYRLERCQGAGCTSFAQIATPSGTTFSDSGLTAATSYSYRARAQDAANNLSGYSNTAITVTPGVSDTTPPGAPGTLTASAVSSSQINLSWGAATDNVGVTGYRVERCTGAGCTGFAQIATPTGASYSDTSLTASTSYSYRVRATDAAGNLGAFSNTGSATTQAVVVGAGLVAAYSFDDGAGATLLDRSGNSNTGAIQGTVAWTTQGKNGGALVFNGTTNRVLVANSPSLNATSGVTLEAWVYPTANQSGWRAILQKEVDAWFLQASNSGGALRPAAGGTYGGVNVFVGAPSAIPINTWTHLAQTYDGSTIRLYVNGTQVSSAARTGALQTTTAPLWIGGNNPYGEYFQGRIDDARVYSRALAASEIVVDMNLPVGGTAPVDTTPPSAPGTLTATAVSASQINLSWGAATDNVAVTGYRVERCAGAGCTTFTQIATPTGTSYSDAGLTASTAYNYRVRATDAAGNLGTFSNTGGATTQVAAGDTTPPSAPGALTASAVSSSQINLSWGAATDNVAVTGYRVERCAGTGCTTFTQIATPSGTSYSDPGLTASTSYSYRVRAADAAGNLGAFSNTGSATTSTGIGTGAFQNEVLISGMNLPTALHFLPNADMLILELGGKIWRVPAGTTQVSATPFLSLSNIGGLNSQQGLMDMVLDPAFETNHYYYVFYTLGSPNRDRVSRFTVTADQLGTVPGSEFVLYQDPQDANAEHHGGALNFANDGKLFVTTGENFDPAAAQDLASPRGKILRINADGSIPTDNPFYDGAGPHRDEVWALGLRNPFRAFYDSPSGRLYVGDVGGNDYSTAQEELNLGVAGANYGWPNCEGSSCGSNPTYTSPIYSYPHLGRDAAITGGFIYRGSQFPPEYYGSYFFADYAQNWIRRLTFDAAGNVSGVVNFVPPDGSADGPYGDIVYLTEGPEGALYYVDLGYSDTTGQTGISKIRRIRFIPDNLPPTAVASATPTQGATAPLTVGFSSAGSNDPDGQPLTYAWSFGDGATSNAANPAHTYAQLGGYTALLTVSDGISATTAEPLQITVGNKPDPTIANPADGSSFRGGDVIAISGDAMDIEDGGLPASAFTWTVDFLHAGHVHPGLPTVGTKSFLFTIPTTGHDFSGNTRFLITLTVTDSNGLKASRSVTIYPEKVDLSFDSQPSGLVINIDGLPYTTPFVHDTVINFIHTVEAPNQVVGQNAYDFAFWFDGGAQQHTIVVPAVAQSYTASYTVGAPPFPPGLIAGYRLDEGVGTTTADVSGNNTTGTLVNAPTWTTGERNGALNFSGTSYVDLGNPSSLGLTGSMTLSAWINISANPFDDGAIVAKLGNAGWQLKTSPDTGVRTAALQISSNGTDSIQRYSTTALTVGTWYHLAGVYDATARTLDVYVNGVLDDGVISGPVPAAQFNAPFNVNIGQRTGMPGGFNFRGRIDEVHIFNRALSASEIQLDMTLAR